MCASLSLQHQSAPPPVMQRSAWTANVFPETGKENRSYGMIQQQTSSSCRACIPLVFALISSVPSRFSLHAAALLTCCCMFLTQPRCWQQLCIRFHHVCSHPARLCEPHLSKMPSCLHLSTDVLLTPLLSAPCLSYGVAVAFAASCQVKCCRRFGGSSTSSAARRLLMT